MLEYDYSKESGNFIAKNSQILKGVLSSAGNAGVSGYVHHRLKKGHPGP